jgi:hypothetical protein
MTPAQTDVLLAALKGVAFVLLTALAAGLGAYSQGTTLRAALIAAGLAGTTVALRLLMQVPAGLANLRATPTTPPT